MTSELEIRRFRSSVKLGCEADERAFAQEVEIDVVLRFAKLPKAMETDDLSDTVCYGELCGELDRVCRAGEYRLVERLGDALFQAIRAFVGESATIELSVHKLKPPVAGLQGGVLFKLQGPVGGNSE